MRRHVEFPTLLQHPWGVIDESISVGCTAPDTRQVHATNSSELATMDPVTHILSAALWTEPLTPPQPEGAVYARWRERAALVLGALLPDGDGVLGWIDLSLYDKYHRVVTHSFFGLVLVAISAALIARLWPETWLLSSLRTTSNDRRIETPVFSRLLLISTVAVSWHFVGDLITAWGIWPAWPFSAQDLKLGMVNSIEPALLGITLVAGICQYYLIRGDRRVAAWITATAWLVLCTLYVLLRPSLLGEPFI